MTTFRYRQRADPGTTFAPHAFDGNIGKTIRVNLPNGDSVAGKVLAAEVVDGGSAALITIEVEGEIPEIDQPASAFRFGIPT